MTMSTDVELQAAEWLIRLEGPCTEADGKAFLQWLSEDPSHRNAYAEIQNLLSWTQMLKKDQDALQSARERIMPELLSERPDVRERLGRNRNPEFAVDAVAAGDVTSVGPEPSSASEHFVRVNDECHCSTPKLTLSASMIKQIVLEGLVDAYEQTSLGVCATPQYSSNKCHAMWDASSERSHDAVKSPRAEVSILASTRTRKAR